MPYYSRGGVGTRFSETHHFEKDLFGGGREGKGGETEQSQFRRGGGTLLFGLTSLQGEQMSRESL